jgi:hypothetical protein
MASIQAQHDRFLKVADVFAVFSDHVACYFDGQSGTGRVPEVRVTRPANVESTQFNVDFLGRSFSARFSAHTEEDGSVIGKLALYEIDGANPSAFVKRAECHFERDGTVIDIEDYRHEYDDPLQIGSSSNAESNIYVVLRMVMAASRRIPDSA